MIGQRLEGLRGFGPPNIRPQNLCPQGDGYQLRYVCRRPAVLTAAEPLIRLVVDRLGNKGHVAIAEQELRPAGMVRLEAPGDVPVPVEILRRAAPLGVRVDRPADWNDRRA